MSCISKFKLVGDEMCANGIVRQAKIVQCKICKSDAKPFDVLDLNKSTQLDCYLGGVAGVPIVYHRCDSCRFIFTTYFDGFSGREWAEIIYNSFYYKAIDPEYESIRPAKNAKFVSSFFLGRKGDVVGVDWGGGNGKTSLLLRDQGWNYDSSDPFGETIVDPINKGCYNVCSLFEVLEHLAEPINTLNEIRALCSNDKLILLIGTVAHDYFVDDKTRLSWWYAAPRNGHVSLFSRATFKFIAKSFGFTYISISSGTHILFRGYSVADVYLMLLRGKIVNRMKSMFVP
jgi:hypothetical protein